MFILLDQKTGKGVDNPEMGPLTIVSFSCLFSKLFRSRLFLVSIISRLNYFLVLIKNSEIFI